MVPVTAIGWKARAALERTGGAAQLMATLSRSIYLTAGAEVVWLGPQGSPLHPRAMLTTAPLAIEGDAARIDARWARSWRAERPVLGTSAARGLVRGCRRLLAAVHEIGSPDGLGVLLLGRAGAARADAAPTADASRGGAPGHDLHGEFVRRAAPRARALAAACARDDGPRAAEAAVALLGLGPGLTPSGDDYVGGAFFARALLARAGAADGDTWRASAADVLARASDLTHPISVALLGDLLEGDGHAPLHDLVRALAEEAPLAVAVDAARRLTRIGHFSGWDLLAGFLAGILGPVDAGPAW